MRPLRVAILGGGMAGLAAAWRLSRPDGPRPDITLYQRGHRLGGKAASSRGVHGRIEEHGLHVWLGYYDHAFGMLRECYEELARSENDPACPIASSRDAFVPASAVGFDSGWVAMFPEDHRVPGEPSPAGPSPADLARRAIALLARLGMSFGPDRSRWDGPAAVLSARAEPPARGGLLTDAVRAVGGIARAPRAELAAVIDLFAAISRGVLVDNVVAHGFASIDDLDFRAWLARHGAGPGTVDSPIVRGMYDFVFGYEDGDRSRPSFSAGLGLALANRMFFEYKGAMFWKMRAGMGDVVIAPLYQALHGRGVRFEFFHRVDALHLSADRSRVDAVTMGRQCTLGPGRDQYEPLVRVRGLPGFPARPDVSQLAGVTMEALAGVDLERHDAPWPDSESVRIEHDRDFDAVVLALSIGIIPLTCGELIAHDPRWRAMVDHVATVATHALQVWLKPEERLLGRAGRAATITGYGAPFDTYAAMHQVLPFEDWPAGDEPRSAVSFCGVHHDGDDVEALADAFLASRAAQIWPRIDEHPNAVVSRFSRANTDPSDRYVQSRPGTAQYRLTAGGSGFDNLALAGDWIDSGLNAGCIEAAVLSGMQAADAIERSA